jgi:hypothetical protein
VAMGKLRGRRRGVRGESVFILPLIRLLTIRNYEDVVSAVATPACIAGIDANIICF